LVDNDNSQVEVKISGPTDDIKKSLTKENNAHTNMDDSYNNSNDKKSQMIVQEIADQIEEQEFEQKPTKRCNLGPYILALAMGIHAAFAGLALGLSKDMKGFIGLLIAVLAHKWAEALTVGINFAKNLEDIGKKQAVILMFIFSLATPIGMAVGLALKGIDDLWQSILFGVSAGTFIYISTTEIIVEEFSVTRHKWAKFFSYLLGIGLMVSIYFIEQATGG
jgi:zinc transporter 1/2/3